jgi:hypothetical protein
MDRLSNHKSFKWKYFRVTISNLRLVVCLLISSAQHKHSSSASFAREPEVKNISCIEDKMSL